MESFWTGREGGEGGLECTSLPRQAPTLLPLILAPPFMQGQHAYAQHPSPPTLARAVCSRSLPCAQPCLYAVENDPAAAQDGHNAVVCEPLGSLAYK